MRKILIIDDDPTICLMLQSLLKRKNFEPGIAFSAGEALKKLEESSFDLILSDFRLPDFDGLELLKRIKAIHPYIPVIIMTSYADIRTAVTAIKMGAFEYVAKPLNPEEILLLIGTALEKAQGAKDQIKEKASHSKPQKQEIQFIRGEASCSLQIDQYIRLVAPTDMSVILQGESGTGKEIAARRIHQESVRKRKPFVAVDCGALSPDLAGSELFGHLKGAFTGAINDKEGQFETANGGTLFLDEIGNLSYEIQVKLLRALQERKIRRVGSNKDVEVDVRIVVASNEDLAQAVNKGTFREDLYHRLNEFKITVPPLREREDDITLFANHFLMLSNNELNKNIQGFSPEVNTKFQNYSWPGNLRELRNVVRRAVLLCQESHIHTNCMPSEILSERPSQQLPSAGTDLKSIKEANERDLIIVTLEKVNFNKSKAARLLNIDRKTLYNKIKQYNINL